MWVSASRSATPHIPAEQTATDRAGGCFHSGQPATDDYLREDKPCCNRV